MRQLVENNVRSAIRVALDDGGLEDTISLSYEDLEYNLWDIVNSSITDPDDDAEYDRLNDECERMAKAVFSNIQAKLKRAQLLINAALPTEGT